MSSSSGNWTKDVVFILNATTVVAQVDAASTLTDTRRFSILEPHDDNDYTRPENLSAVVVAVVPCIAGFVVRKVCKTTTCEEYIAALYLDELVPLVEQKNRGGFVSPSKGVTGLCEAVEKGLRRLQIECGTFQAVNSRSKHLVLEVLRLSVEEKLFQKLEQHILDLDLLDNHIYSLCKKVAELYVKVRIHHMTKERNREIIKVKFRPVLSRMTIFKHHADTCRLFAHCILVTRKGSHQRGNHDIDVTCEPQILCVWEVLKAGAFVSFDSVSPTVCKGDLEQGVVQVLYIE
ncbi:hypothetical protein HPB51_004750 [Rhipicephalus microplus]|uniref:Uncharacterized protein n=1 Tax=Rhipicephalus microplus TaxID=6941 RepID=A0A9J6DT86_RHIMP|nr:hypothetical protein HPB51_004750 [Rhipicephalus microplus]